MSKKALIIVDMQNDFCPSGALPVKEGDVIVVPINSAIKYALNQNFLVVKSRDWHGEDMGEHFKVFPKHCVKDTLGAEFHPDLLPCPAVIISKGMEPDQHGFSPFEGKDLSSGESLLEILTAQRVSDVYICGLATDYCVLSCALDATKKGFRTFLLEDACRAVNVNPGDGDRAITHMKEACVIMTTTGEVINGQN